MAVVLLLALLSVFSLGANLLGEVMPQDEGLLLVYPDLILRGYTPYRDFFAGYPPGGFYVIAGAFRLFGDNIVVERLVGVGYKFLMAAAVYSLGLRISWSTALISAVSVLAVLRLFTAPGAYSMFGALAILLFAFLCAYRGCEVEDFASQKKWAVLAGLLAGSIYWFRVDVGVIGTVALIVTIDPSSFRRVGLFLIALALPTCALIAFAIAVGPSVMFDSMVADLIRIAPGRKLPVHISYSLVGLFVCVTVNAVIAFKFRVSEELRYLAWLSRGIAVLSVGVLPTVLQRADEWHITYAGAAIAGLTVISLSGFLTRVNWHAQISKASTVLLVAAVIGIFGIGFVRGVESDREILRITSGDRWVPAKNRDFLSGSNSVVSDANGLVGEINQLALPGDKLFVGPRDSRFTNYNDTFLYYLLPNLRPASRYLEMNPGAANRPGSGLADQIDSADWLILTSRYVQWNEPNASMVPGSSLPNEIISHHFCIYSEHDVWQLLGRCSLNVSRQTSSKEIRH